MIKRGMYVGCTLARHKALGVHVAINAHSNELWRNDLTLDEIEMYRDGNAIKDYISKVLGFMEFVLSFSFVTSTELFI